MTQYQLGSTVWLAPRVGYRTDSHKYQAVIIAPPKEYSAPNPFPCRQGCGNLNCREWGILQFIDGTHCYHVSECQMFDEPQQEGVVPLWAPVELNLIISGIDRSLTLEIKRHQRI